MGHLNGFPVWPWTIPAILYIIRKGNASDSTASGLVPYHLVFCHKKQENLCVFASLCEAFWLRLCRFSQVSHLFNKGKGFDNQRLWVVLEVQNVSAKIYITTSPHMNVCSTTLGSNSISTRNVGAKFDYIYIFDKTQTDQVDVYFWMETTSCEEGQKMMATCKNP